jgi:hypothetical protein
MSEQTQITDKVIVIVDGRDVQLDQASLGLTMQSTKDEVLRAVQGVIAENLSDSHGEYSFDVRYSLNNRNITVYPKTPAG